MFDDNEGTFILEGDTKFSEETVGRLADDLVVNGSSQYNISIQTDQSGTHHRRHKLASQPSTSSRCNVGLDDGDLQVRTVFA